MKRCQARTRGGDQCRNNAIPGTNHCYLKSHGADKTAFFKRFFNFLVNKWIILLFTIILGIIPICFNHYQNQINANFGILVGEKKAEKKIIAIGGIRIIMQTSEGVVIRDNGEPVLSIQIRDGKLYVSVIIRGNNGDLIAEIRDNEWKLNQRFDRNYSDNALEVRDKSGYVVLQIVNFGDVIHFAGTFYNNNGYAVSFVPFEDLTAAIAFGPSVKDLQFHIDPIFEYPSELHFGSCPGFKKLENIVRSGNSTFYFGNSIDIGKHFRAKGSIGLL